MQTIRWPHMKQTIHTQGKRKSATARATLKAGKGKVKVNGQFLANFSNELLRLRLSEPLVLAGAVASRVDVEINIKGGGVNGQSDAARVALARALVAHDESLKKTF